MLTDMDSEQIVKKEPYNIILEAAEGEIEEKKSRFIATLVPVQSEEEAIHFIETMKKKYWDARHNCYAYIIGEGNPVMRCSDDGEPSGTAGRPMLEVLIGAQLCNVIVVVTRYFGGTLLGTGGLVRAYTQAVQAGLENADIKTMRYGVLIQIQTDYNGVGKLQYIFGQRGITIEDSIYADNVTLKVRVPIEQKNEVIHAVTEATAGRAGIETEDPAYYIS